jgi:hypothetical protein
VLGLILALIATLIWVGTNIATNASNFFAHLNDIAEDAEGTPETYDQECTNADIRIDLMLTNTDHAVGDAIQLTATTTYLGTTGCKISTASDYRILTVTSGNEIIFSSAGCDVPDSGLMLSANDSVQQQVNWNAHRSNGVNCDIGEVARPGYYRANLNYPSIPGLASNQISFSIGGR